MKQIINIFFVCEESYSLFSGEFSQSRFGGAGLQMYFLADELSKDADYKVYFIFQEHDVQKLDHPRIEFRNPILPIKYGVPILSRYINLSRRRALFECIGPVVVISTMARNLSILLSYAKDAEASSILRIASDTDISNPWGVSEAEKNNYLKKLCDVDFFMCQTEAQKDALWQRGLKKSTVAGNGMPQSLFDSTSSSGKHILWVGSGQPIKQPWYFLDIAQEFPNENFLMIMPLMSVEIEEFVKRRCEKLPNVRLITEQMPFIETCMHFSNAKMLVNTSVFEGLPNTFLQATGAGIPIFSLSVNPDDILRDCGYCAEGKMFDLVEEIACVIRDKEKLQKYNKRAREYFENYFDIFRTADAYKTTIKKIVNGTQL